MLNWNMARDLRPGRVEPVAPEVLHWPSKGFGVLLVLTWGWCWYQEKRVLWSVASENNIP